LISALWLIVERLTAVMISITGDGGDAIVACVELETIPQGKDFIVDKLVLAATLRSDRDNIVRLEPNSYSLGEISLQSNHTLNQIVILVVHPKYFSHKHFSCVSIDLMKGPFMRYTIHALADHLVSHTYFVKTSPQVAIRMAVVEIMQHFLR